MVNASAPLFTYAAVIDDRTADPVFVVGANNDSGTPSTDTTLTPTSSGGPEQTPTKTKTPMAGPSPTRTPTRTPTAPGPTMTPTLPGPSATPTPTGPSATPTPTQPGHDSHADGHRRHDEHPDDDHGAAHDHATPTNPGGTIHDVSISNFHSARRP